MFIKEVTWRQRDDFHFIAKCEHCGHEHKRGDGYADMYFQRVVLPSQACPECDLNTLGMTPAQFQAALDSGEVTINR